MSASPDFIRKIQRIYNRLNGVPYDGTVNESVDVLAEKLADLTEESVGPDGKILHSKLANSFEPKTSSFTAQNGGYYSTTGTVTVTDPASPVAGDYYFVLVQTGSATIGGQGYLPSRVPICRYYNGSSWGTLGPEGEVVGTTATQTLTNKTIVGSTLTNATINSSTLQTPTINNATLSGGSISGASISGGSVVTSDIVSPKIVLDSKSSSFTAEAYKYYATTGTVTVTDPASPNAGHYYFVLVQSGTATIGGTGFAASRIPIYRYYNGTSWVTLPISVDWAELANIPANITTWAGKTPPTGDAVGTTDAQTLTNKILTSPTLTSPTINSDATFNGSNNTAPNQTAASAASLMTRELSDARYLGFANLRVIQSNTVSVANSGAGSSASGNDTQWYARGNPGTADNGYARMTVARGLNNLSFSGNGIRFFLPIGGAFLIYAGCFPDSSEKSFRIIFGGNAGVPAPADSNALSTMGFGMEIKYESGSPKWRLFAHNGTTYTTSPSWQTFPGNPSSLGDHVACVIESNGAGTISARVGYGYGPNADLRNAAVHSITGGPTALGDLTNSYVDLVAVNPTTGAPHYQHSNFTIISRPQFYI
jgi:hypothetical protein